MAGRGRRRWIRLTAIAVVVLAGVAVAGYLWLTNDPADPVDVDEVVAEFRAEDDEVVAVGSSSAPPSSGAVLPGVYAYDTTGFERVDALDGSTHDYPATTTMTLRSDDRGCIRSRWDALAQRWDELVRCPGPDGWRHESQIVYHEFFRMGEERGFICEQDSIFLPADLSPGVTFSATCRSGGGDRSGASAEVIAGEVIGLEQLTVGGEPVETVHVTYGIEVSGETTGHTVVDRWFAIDIPTLLVREVREGSTTSDTVIGEVQYDERYELNLRSLEPIT